MVDDERVLVLDPAGEDPADLVHLCRKWTDVQRLWHPLRHQPAAPVEYPKSEVLAFLDDR